MSTERVDKAWQSKGLTDYPTEAILGTLGHYGIQVAEAEFRQLGEKRYPVDIAEGWLPQWKGKGQFAPFPYAAAAELWRRWLPEKLAPMELTESLAQLMGTLGELLEGSQEAAVGPAFERMESVRKRVPLNEKGEPDEPFMRDALAPFDEKATEAFNLLAEMLAKEGHADDAEAFADLEEFLLPVRQGVSRAVVRAANGEREPAIEDLRKVAADSARVPLSRLLAVDALLHLGAFEQTLSVARPLLEEAEREKDWHLALDMCSRLEFAYKRLGDRASLQALERDKARLEAAHDEAHPGHRRHHHH
ncbi:MAG TPA: hypothetical protein VLQ93_22125 [Myxococcaceae bacterium]|nr:hypothetical protein [Myxococcaceae bacterium]